MTNVRIRETGRTLAQLDSGRPLYFVKRFVFME